MSVQSEDDRLGVLRSYRILDSARESAYDDLVRLAALVCSAPMAVLSFIDADRQWFKSAVGLSFRQTDRALAFGSHAIESDEPFLVEDAAAHPRFADHPMVLGDPGIRFYAGIPLVTPSGARIGALAVLDRQTRRLTPEQLALLSALARQVMTLLELRVREHERREAANSLDRSRARGAVGSWQLPPGAGRMFWSAGCHAVFGTRAETFGADLGQVSAQIHGDDRERWSAALANARGNGGSLDLEFRIHRSDGETRLIRAEAQALPADDDATPVLTGTFRDVTAEREVDAVWREQRAALAGDYQLLNAHVENSPLAVVEWDPEFRVMRWSPLAVALFGWEADEVMGRQPGEFPFVHADDRADVDRVMGALLSGAVSRNVSVNRNLTRTGQVVHCEWYNSVQRDSAGSLISIFSLVHDVTPRVRAESARTAALERERAARREAEAARRHFQSLFESAPGLYLVVEPEHFWVVGVSDAFLSATGMRRPAVTGRDLFDLLRIEQDGAGREGIDALRASLARVKASGRPDALPVQRFEPGGAGVAGRPSARHWSVVSSPVADAAGEPVYIILRIEDVTAYMRERGRLRSGSRRALMSRVQRMEADIVLRAHELQRLNDELRASESLRRIAGRLGRIGGWAVRLASDEVHWSPEIFDLLEWPDSEPPTLGRSLELYPPRWRERMRAALGATAEQGVPFDIEVEMVTARGRRRWVRAAGEPERDDSGSIVRVVGALQDISEHKAAETERNQLAARLNASLESMTDAFYMLDADWRLVYLNRQAAGLLHVEREAVLGRDVRETFPETGDTVLFGEYDRAMRDGESRHFEFFSPLQEHWFEVHAYPYADGLAVYFRAVTERHELEEQLHQARRLESVGQLTGGVAHDFNNLLTVILGNADLLQEALADDHALYPLVETIGNAAQRGADLTQRLLAFARRQALEPRAVDVNRLVGGMDGMLRRTLGEHIEVRMAAETGLWTARVDRAQLESALLNLCINARDAMPAGGRLTIETANARLDRAYADQQAEVQPGPYVMLVVSDTGCGIDPDEIGKVFEPFYTTKARGKGTGLGLSMVFGFMKQSGGHVKLYSEPGVGTSVKMYLPRATVADDPESAREASAPAAGGAETVLMVEDDALVRGHVERQLRTLGYRVVAAASGVEALEALRGDDHVDLLFTDVVMPGGMSGPELVEAAHGMRPALPVLYTSGYTENAIIHHGQVDPGVQLLSKPYRREDLARRIRQVLDESGQIHE